MYILKNCRAISSFINKFNRHYLKTRVYIIALEINEFMRNITCAVASLVVVPVVPVHHSLLKEFQNPLHFHFLSNVSFAYFRRTINFGLVFCNRNNEML